MIRYAITLLFIICHFANSQLYIPADPRDLIFTERNMMMSDQISGSLMIRPIISQFDTTANNWSVKFRNEFIYNSGSPNLENTSDRWIGKGGGFFTSMNFVYNNKYVFASAEPYYFISQNSDYDEPQRQQRFNNLNDNRPHLDMPYTSAGIRETQLYLNFKGIGGGFSNANMWWGPGIHNSLMMSNNTNGFKHLMLGTVTERRIKNWGFNGRYIFSKLGEKSKSKPYLSGFFLNTTYYSIPTITLGFSRIFLSGGKKSEYDISATEAALLPFELIEVERSNGKSISHSPVGQTYTGYVNLRFPKSRVVLFLEWGRTEGSEDFNDFLLTPDHSDAFIFGLRKYGLFDNSNLFLALEYANIAHSSLWKTKESYDWYSDPQFDYYTYNGRHWAAHSGPDSDDFTFLFGYANNKYSVMPSFNYERHGLTHPFIPTHESADSIVYDSFFRDYFLSEERDIFRGDGRLAETKLEFRCDFRYMHNEYHFSLYYEYEYVLNDNFSGNDEGDSRRSGNVFWFAVEKDLTESLLNWFK